MALAGYFSGKPERNEHSSSEDKDQDRSFFANLGMNEEQQQLALEETSKDREEWNKITLQDSVQPNHFKQKQALGSGVLIGFSYAVGGAISLLPFFIFSQTIQALKISAIVSLLLIFFFGWIKNRLNGISNSWNAFLVTLIGALAAAATFIVARIFWNG